MQHEPGTMGRLGVVESRQSLTRIATKKQWTGKIRIATLQIILHRKIDVHVDFFSILSSSILHGPLVPRNSTSNYFRTPRRGWTDDSPIIP